MCKNIFLHWHKFLAWHKFLPWHKFLHLPKSQKWKDCEWCWSTLILDNNVNWNWLVPSGNQKNRFGLTRNFGLTQFFCQVFEAADYCRSGFPDKHMFRSSIQDSYRHTKSSGTGCASLDRFPLGFMDKYWILTQICGIDKNILCQKTKLEMSNTQKKYHKW